MLCHRYQRSSLRTENRKKKRTFAPNPVRFYPHSKEYNITVIITYQPVQNTTDITIKASMQRINAFKPWRRERDLNPRYGITAHMISNHAP